MAVYTYATFLSNGKFGYGAAISWAMFVVIVVIVGINLTLARRLRGMEES
jgi:cellobiose transport system permease protein